MSAVDKLRMLVAEWRNEAVLDDQEVGRKPETQIKIDLSWKALARRSRDSADQVEAILDAEEAAEALEEDRTRGLHEYGREREEARRDAEGGHRGGWQ